MGGQETNHSQYVQATDPNAGYAATHISGGVTFKKKEEILNFAPINIKVGIDKKATHLWDKNRF